jgi:hypothetical protein
VVEHEKIPTPSMRYGKSSSLRVDRESVIKFILKSKRPLTPREPDSLKAGDSCLPDVVKVESNLPA